jgi:hypothetical protein
MGNIETQISVFFSWQSDSNKKTNLNFIEECLRKAVKEISREESIIIILDRDTKGVGGSPSIVDTILKKIRSCDVFVWDGTIINKTARFTPNPNVLIELGYAFAVIGEGRIIGVMNKFNGIGPDQLPFDLVHRRWPILYNLDISSHNFTEEKNKAKIELIQNLKSAISSALNEPKIGVIQSDIDFHTARKLWNIINSDWMDNWLYSRRQNIQYERHESLEKFENYYFTSRKHEFQFVDELLHDLHEKYLHAIQNYLTTAVTEMCTDHGNKEILVINIKDLARREGWIKDYDKMYDKQVNNLLKAIGEVEEAWKYYIKSLRLKFHEITHNLADSE